MQIENGAAHKKNEIPWYDSETICLITLIFLYFVFFFGISGISVVREYHEYYKHIWVPVLLMIMSGITIISITLRLIGRFFQHIKNSQQ
ncbi:Uncharacterized protein dnl_11340 [Desulfonema limicola]|uniref:Uncharacterized protein n=1 Tax=Desulfonema limicola TaxID=45656 RepID=A0A975B4Z7_9BACT|nr:hypothetical protein [Desulfonema limicola]QTA78887.1 Uncharacterized protein dnl_11340 [Desulfonema limicola]